MRGSASERWLAAVAALLLALVTRTALADEVSVGSGARPALRRVGLPIPGRAGAGALALGVAGGVTEPLSDADSAHARVAGTAAAALNAARFLDFAARLDARYDRHPQDSLGADDGLVFQPELSTRLAFRTGDVGLGFEAAAFLPAGADVGTSASALSADGKLLLSVHGRHLVVAGHAGYRLDRSAEAAEDASRLRFGDRSALGASEYDQALVGIGLGYTLGRTLLFAEATGQLLLGAPRLDQSPLWLSLGVRKPIAASGLSWEVAFDALLSARPDPIDAALVPIEPRALLAFGLRYELGRVRPRVRPVVTPPPPRNPPRSSSPWRRRPQLRASS